MSTFPHDLPTVRVPSDDAVVYPTTIPQDPGEQYVVIETRTNARLVVHAGDLAAALAARGATSVVAAPEGGYLTEGQFEDYAAASWPRRAGTPAVKLGNEEWHDRHRRLTRDDLTAAGITIIAGVDSLIE